MNELDTLKQLVAESNNIVFWGRAEISISFTVFSEKKNIEFPTGIYYNAGRQNEMISIWARKSPEIAAPGIFCANCHQSNCLATCKCSRRLHLLRQKEKTK